MFVGALQSTLVTALISSRPLSSQHGTYKTVKAYMCHVRSTAVCRSVTGEPDTKARKNPPVRKGINVKSFNGFYFRTQCQNLAVTVVHVLYSLGSNFIGWYRRAGHHGHEESARRGIHHMRSLQGHLPPMKGYGGLKYLFGLVGG